MTARQFASISYADWRNPYDSTPYQVDFADYSVPSGEFSYVHQIPLPPPPVFNTPGVRIVYEDWSEDEDDEDEEEWDGNAGPYPNLISSGRKADCLQVL